MFESRRAKGKSRFCDTAMKWVLTMLVTASAYVSSAQTFSKLVDFSTSDGAPFSTIQGADGNFYVATSNSLIEITPAGVKTTLYTFTTSNPTSLLQVADGTFYGTALPVAFGNDDGSVFHLTPAGAFTSLYTFSGPDGSIPGNLIQGVDGGLYGTTVLGGSTETASSVGGGTVFKLTTTGSFTTLHNFSGADGADPSVIIQGTDGDFYGITRFGGSGPCQEVNSGPFAQGCGTIFKITPTGSLTTVHDFDMTDGNGPESLIQGTDGNFYGVTGSGGTCQPSGCGTIFQMTPGGSLSALTSAVNFPRFMIQASNGSFYGAAGLQNGVCNDISCGGNIFQLTLPDMLSTTYTFCSQTNCSDGVFPNSLVQATDGNLYGTTSSGGIAQNGTFFKLTPAPAQTPLISANGVLNGASFQASISADSWMTIKGTNLAPKTDNWNNAIVNGVLPTSLDGVSVMVGDQPAYIEYVSAMQVNALVPDVPAGALAVTVTTPIGASQPVMAQVSAVQPAFFQWGNYVVATRQDFSLAVKSGTFPGTTTVPAAPGDVIILWGTGFGPTSPSAPVGVETPSTTTYDTANNVTVTVGKQPATVYGAALAPGYAGLYQVAIQIPALANGDYPVVATVAGALSPSATLITVQQ
jgi:uncharacterized protein (TIGR03437 family)